MKWLPAPRLPTCVRPRSIALWVTGSALAPGMAPFCSVCSTSSLGRETTLEQPRHAALDQLRQLARLQLERPAVVQPLRDAPHQLVHELLGARPDLFVVQPVMTRRTPQLMSKPTPPGDTTPSSARNAATPPMGKP